LFASTPGTPEFQKVHEEQDEIVRRIAKQAPDARHRARLKALYVERGPAGEWQRPAMMTRDEATPLISDAMNDYSVLVGNIKVDLVHPLGPRVARLLEQWPERPSLPAPRWPRWPSA